MFGEVTNALDRRNPCCTDHRVPDVVDGTPVLRAASCRHLAAAACRSVGRALEATRAVRSDAVLAQPARGTQPELASPRRSAR
ncbi:MAG: hypothetical protein MZV64_44840 [Ignavibacteriales bacterium]|nr:hypothetical protein [Ignavibacteriales bacterium]